LSRRGISAYQPEARASSPRLRFGLVLSIFLAGLYWPGIMMSSSSSNDVAAEFVRLLAANERRLGSYVATLVPNWNDAEDILQQTKARLWEQFATYDRQKDFGVWACVIARYEVLAFRTRAARSRVQFSQEFIDRVADDLAHAASEADSRMSYLEECLKKLSDWQRELLWRCCVHGDSTTQVALELGRKADSIRKAVLRIRRTLYHCIEVARRKEAEQP
jgi:RNA polymerase sigma-70 factor, ECF subfamily